MILTRRSSRVFYKGIRYSVYNLCDPIFDYDKNHAAFFDLEIPSFELNAYLAFS